MKVDVLLDTRRRTWNPSSGTGVYAARLADEAGAVDSGLEISFLDRSRFVDMSQTSQSTIHRLARWPRKLASDLVEVPARSASARLTHLLYPEGMALGRFVVTVQDIDVIEGGPSHALSSKYYAWRTVALAKGAARVLCPSRQTASGLERILGSAHNIDVVHLGVDVPVVAETVVAARPYLLYTGGSAARKNVSSLFAAWDLVRREFSGELLITGGFSDWPHALPPGVRRLGVVSRDRLWGLYATAAAVLYPSPKEGFGFPVLEGALLGRPVICGCVGIVPELEPGLVLTTDVRSSKEIAAAVFEALSGWTPDPVAVDRARAHFTWRRCAEETLGIYRSLL
jgi:glycosyltransferase involved in cell wall biosynthesis